MKRNEFLKIMASVAILPYIQAPTMVDDWVYDPRYGLYILTETKRHKGKACTIMIERFSINNRPTLFNCDRVVVRTVIQK